MKLSRKIFKFTVFKYSGPECDFSGFTSNDDQGEVKVEMNHRTMAAMLRPNNRYIKCGASKIKQWCLQTNCFSGWNIGFPLILKQGLSGIEFIS